MRTLTRTHARTFECIYRSDTFHNFRRRRRRRRYGSRTGNVTAPHTIYNSIRVPSVVSGVSCRRSLPCVNDARAPLRNSIYILHTPHARCRPPMSPRPGPMLMMMCAHSLGQYNTFFFVHNLIMIRGVAHIATSLAREYCAVDGHGIYTIIKGPAPYGNMHKSTRV